MCGIALNQSLDGIAEQVSSQRKAGRRSFNGGLCSAATRTPPILQSALQVLRVDVDK